MFFLIEAPDPANLTMADSNIQTPSQWRKERELKEHDRIALVGMMIGMAQDGKLPHGAFKKLAEKYRVAPKTISRLWLSCPQSVAEGIVDIREVSSKRHERGRKLVWDRDEMVTATMAVPLQHRMTYRDLA